LLGLAACIWSGCATEAGLPLPPVPLPVCTDSITVSVTLSLPDSLPVFAWTPDCTVGRLIVEQGFDEYWGTETPGPNTYPSPITYGINPPGSAAEEPPLPLTPGETYLVTIWRFVVVDPESLQLVGSATFTR
jgi:hypothetical protein